MIIGNGDIASVLRDRPDLLFMASGLSNSRKVTYEDFVREKNLILKHRFNHLVYFSTLCRYYSESLYADYKAEMERIVVENCTSYTIVRIGNITWGDNPNTLINYLKNNPKAERRDEIRYVIDQEEFLHWMTLITPGYDDIMNIPGRMVNVKDI